MKAKGKKKAEPKARVEKKPSSKVAAKKSAAKPSSIPHASTPSETCEWEACWGWVKASFWVRSVFVYFCFFGSIFGLKLPISRFSILKSLWYSTAAGNSEGPPVWRTQGRALANLFAHPQWWEVQVFQSSLKERIFVRQAVQGSEALIYQRWSRVDLQLEPGPKKKWPAIIVLRNLHCYNHQQWL